MIGNLNVDQKRLAEQRSQGKFAFNPLMSKITPKLWRELHPEVRRDLIDSIDQIGWIEQFTKPDRKTVSELERNEKNPSRVIVDISRPHILENMDFFREAALHYKETGVYTHLYPNSQPNSAYYKFWEQEVHRCKHGLTREDGEWISGYYYFYLNYSPILVANSMSSEFRDGDSDTIRSDRDIELPWVWDGDYFYFHYIEQAEAKGRYCNLLKTRGRGFSYKSAAMLARNALMYPRSKSYAMASETEFLTKDAILNKAWDVLDFCAANTPWPRLRLVDQMMHKKLGYKDKKLGIDRGFKSEIIGVTTKDNPDKARGKRGKLILLEESGKYPGLKKVWSIARPSMEQGRRVFGMMIAGGCFTENNFVWDSNGRCIPIKNLLATGGILGFDGSTGKVTKEPITYMRPPTKKECVFIRTNTGRYVECSLDHPLLWSKLGLVKATELPKVNGKRRRLQKKVAKWNRAGNINVGEQIAVIDKADVFSDSRMWEPRLIGWLIGDGSYGYDKTPVLSNCESEINNYIEHNLDTALEKTYITTTGKRYKETRIKGICPRLRTYGIYGQTKSKKTLPLGIHGYCREDILEFIGGLFDADGYVSNDGSTISISQSHKSILLELMTLLQKFGIHGNIHYKKPNLNNPISKNGHYELEIKAKDSVLRFARNIELYPAEKQRRLLLSRVYYKNRVSEHASHLKGMRFERVVEVSYVGFKDVYNLTAGLTHTYISNGVISANTGGTLGADFEAAEEFFYYPVGYKIHELPNMWDKVMGKGTCSFFFPEYINREDCYDSNGNSDIVAALIQIFEDRMDVKYNTSDPHALTQEKADRPITPQEAVMRVEGTLFPVADIKDYLADILPNLEHFISPHYIGRISRKDKGISWIPDSNVFIVREFPVKDNIDKTGGIEIFEMPKKADNKKPPLWRYIAGIDPYDDDHSTTNSLGSILILDTFTDRIVAEYTGRPRLANDFYEQCIRLLELYNAMANYENDKKGLYSYFYQKNMLFRLCETPQILRDMNMVSGKGYGNKAVGTNSSKRINQWGRRLQADWMLSPAYEGTDQDDIPLMNLQKIRSIGYLKEAAAWNPDGNFDRISAMGMLMILREDIRKYTDTRREYGDSAEVEDPFFSRNYKAMTGAMDFSSDSDKEPDDYLTANFKYQMYKQGATKAQVEKLGKPNW